MSSDYYLYKIEKDKHEKFKKIAIENNTTIHDLYGNCFWQELIEIETWSGHNELSEVLTSLNVEVGDSIYAEVTEKVLKQAKELLIVILEKKFSDVLTDIKQFKPVTSEFTRQDNVSAIIQILNDLNQCLQETNFTEEIILYEVSA